MSSGHDIPIPLLAEGKPRRVRIPSQAGESSNSLAGLRRIAATASMPRLRRAVAEGRPSGLAGEGGSGSMVVMDGGRYLMWWPYLAEGR